MSEVEYFTWIRAISSLCIKKIYVKPQISQNDTDILEKFDRILYGIN